ncbi:conserved hypothetical protein [Ricinus communis]|uniref:Secreted protein n=1 Tax=Ricinus communis TaxID=3988 RepID=B9S115_RICCO|nr:conserved hypothetical protein [Ricinus communis]
MAPVMLVLIFILRTAPGLAIHRGAIFFLPSKSCPFLLFQIVQHRKMILLFRSSSSTPAKEEIIWFHHILTKGKPVALGFVAYGTSHPYNRSFREKDMFNGLFLHQTTRTFRLGNQVSLFDIFQGANRIGDNFPQK